MKFILFDRPRLNHWSLSPNHRWLYKKFQWGIPWKKTLYFLQIIVWIKYNWDHAEFTQQIPPSPPQTNPPKIGWSLGFISFYTLGK